MNEADLVKWTQADTPSLAPEGSMSQPSPLKRKSSKAETKAMLPGAVTGAVVPTGAAHFVDSTRTASTPRAGSTATIKVHRDPGSAESPPAVKRRRLDSVETNIRTPTSRGVAAENILSVGSKRKAATAASEKLYEDVMDANKFAKERKRKDIVSPKSRRAAKMPVPVDVDSMEVENEDGDMEVSKSARKSGTQSARKLQAITDMKPDLLNVVASRRARSRTAASVSAEPDPGVKLSKVEQVKWTTTGVKMSDQDLKVRFFTVTDGLSVC